MMWHGYSEPVRKYTPYKNEQFAKKLDKMRNLIKSVDETSLREEDKKLLLSKMKDLLP